MTNNDAQEYNAAAICQLLLAAFTPEELDRLFRFSANPQLQNVAKEFSPGDGLTMMVDKAISYCDRYILLPELLDEVKQANPRQYARFFGPEPSKKEPAPSTPEPALSASDRDTLSISHPISLLLVRVPAGEFLMGSVVARDKHAYDDELPPHTVYLPDFYIGKYPVTNTQYQAFVRATGHRAPGHWEQGRIPAGKDNHPVVAVSWDDAVAFCDWLSRETKQPFRLPTEAEWEKSARGTDGRIYPWGDEPLDEDRCNFGKNVGDTTTIGRYSPQGDSPYGCADMAGNVHDWCQSLYRPYPYQVDDGREDLKAGGWRVRHGGSWWSVALYVRCACRHWSTSDVRSYDLGFRVARGPVP
jgi:formylglycine-generating enzyme required for sulfatase activity